jgi:hypothetical protein
MEKPPFGFPKPAGAWRCSEIKAGMDDEWRLTHSGYLHASPNRWLFNYYNRNDAGGTTKIFGDMLPGWSERYGNRFWRRMSLVWRPSSVASLVDNVAYWYEAHKHNEARESVGRADEMFRRAQEDESDSTDDIGAHDALGTRPMVFLDGHAAAVPISREFWESGASYFTAWGSSSGELLRLSKAEVEHFMWFIGNKDEVKSTD